MLATSRGLCAKLWPVSTVGSRATFFSEFGRADLPGNYGAVSEAASRKLAILDSRVLSTETPETTRKVRPSVRKNSEASKELLVGHVRVEFSRMQKTQTKREEMGRSKRKNNAGERASRRAAFFQIRIAYRPTLL